MFHLAGIPSYLVLAELSVKRVLHGRTAYSRIPGGAAPAGQGGLVGARGPDVRLRTGSTRLARRLTQCAGLVAQAAAQAAHAVLAARGEWITNEKTLLTRAGLRQVDEFIAGAGTEPAALLDIVDRTRAACVNALQVD